MTTPDLNKTHTAPCLANSNLAERKTNNDIKIEISKEILMMLHDNAYNGAEVNDAVDHITRFLEIIDLVKIPKVDQEQLCIFAFPYSLTGNARRWWMHEGNDMITSWVELVDKLFYKYYPLSRASKTNDANSSDDKNNKSNHQDANMFFDPYLNDNDKGNESHHMERNDNTSGPENFIPNDAPHSGNKEEPNEGMCKVDKFEVIKYSIGDNEEFMGIRMLERGSWAQTVNGISSIYLDIFRKKDEWWTVHRTK
ncbi:hypothetical protein Tco_0963998 [Tanacetum coccineum]